MEIDKVILSFRHRKTNILLLKHYRESNISMESNIVAKKSDQKLSVAFQSIARSVGIAYRWGTFRSFFPLFR